ncbi:MAG TPA: Hsp20/alpha crystallin family protein, partial [bacterium]|nr:Hsp20/alpha crystallin family protein [bacterium]
MNLVKRRHDLWDPLDWMGDLQHEMNRAFNRSFLKRDGWEKTFMPEIDVLDEKDMMIVKADIPGLKKEELDIKVEGRLLTLQGERKQEKETKEKNFYTTERFYGAFTRTIELPTDV